MHPSRFPRRLATPVLALVVALPLIGCNDTQPLPSGTQDPSFYNNATGALGMRNAAVYSFDRALPTYIEVSALMSDELTDVSTVIGSAGASIVNAGAVQDPLDERLLPELGSGATGVYPSDLVYSRLQGARTSLLQAIGQLATYDSTSQDRALLAPSADSALRGELYALYGYTEILLADLYCSGIPLSTIVFQHDFTYRPPSVRDAVYWDAIAHFDTALTLSHDSTRILNLARVGKGRAYLDLDSAQAAADDVANVPTDFVYQVPAQMGGTSSLGVQQGKCIGAGCTALNSDGGIVADREGGHGLPYLSSGDPRTTDTTVILGFGGNSITTVNSGTPLVYIDAIRPSTTPFAQVTIASGVEAQLIQAEFALRFGNVNGWLTGLNSLRATAPLPGGVGPTTADTLFDTLGVTGCDANDNCNADGVSGGTFLVPAGFNLASVIQIQLSPAEVTYCSNFSYYNPCYIGNLDTVEVYIRPARNSPLQPLTDPGSDSARIALTFAERAAWLYMTGHRQGDLRRQLRQYSQYWPDGSRVYPSGVYIGLGPGFYGTDVTAPIPQAEYLNPLFHGCHDRAP